MPLTHEILSWVYLLRKWWVQLLLWRRDTAHRNGNRFSFERFSSVGHYRCFHASFRWSWVQMDFS